MSYRCTGCKFSTSNAVGLGLHEKSCRRRTSNIAEILKKRKAAVELAEADELRKRLRVDTEALETHQVLFYFILLGSDRIYALVSSTTLYQSHPAHPALRHAAVV